MTAKTYIFEAAKDREDALLLDIDALERRANAMGLYPCARALNNAKNAAGWQLAGNISEADAASTRRL